MSFFQSLDSIEDNIESTPIGVTFTTIEYTNNSFLENIKNGKLSDIKIRDTIKYGNYLDYDNFNNTKTRVIFQELWTNLRFINNVLTLLNTNENFLDMARKIYCTSINKIVYDYYTTEMEGEKDSEVLDTLLRIAYTVNYKYILKLTPLVGDNTASFICLGRYSSFDKRKCVERLNSFIINLGYDFSIEDIIKIYSIFYLDSFTEVFINTMFDTDKLIVMEENNKKTYDNISLALLYILEDMNSGEISKVLRSYSSNIMLLNLDKKYRFSMKTIGQEFIKINNVISDLEFRGYNIP